MTIAKLTAVIRCDGCTKPFDVTLDPAQRMSGSSYETVDQYIDDMIRAGDTFVLSIQGDHQLCDKCTEVVDAAYPDNEETLTYDQVSTALNKAAGV